MIKKTIDSSFLKSSEPKPPIWLTEAVENLDSKYLEIAQNIQKNIILFTTDVVEELEKKLNGTIDINNVNYRLSAHKQRVLFMMHAIQYAYDKKFTKATRQNLLDQQQLKNNIALKSRELADLLREIDTYNQNTKNEKVFFNPVELMLTPERKPSQIELSENYDLILNAIDNNFNMGLFIASLLDRIAQIIVSNDNLIINRNVLQGFSSREKKLDFFSTFSTFLQEKTEERGSFMPNNFKLTNKCWAALTNVLTNEILNEQDIVMFSYREKKKLKDSMKDFNKKTDEEKFDSYQENYFKYEK